MNRKRQQAELVFQIGQALGPILKLAENFEQYDKSDRTLIAARLSSDVRELMPVADAFFSDQPGAIFAYQRHRFTNLAFQMFSSPMPPEELCRFARDKAKELVDIVLEVPTPLDSAIHEASTPFSTYRLVRDLCSTIRQRLVWLDRFFDQTVFHRYLAEVPPNAVITLVTLPAANATSKTDKARVAEFRDISRSFAQERGPEAYRLIESENFHDRWLLCDDQPYTLGGSIKDLTKPYTIAKLERTDSNLKHFEDAAENGTEVFGPSSPTHP